MKKNDAYRNRLIQFSNTNLAAAAEIAPKYLFIKQYGDDEYSTLTLLQGRIHSLQNQIDKGTVTNEDARVEMNRLRQSFSNTIDNEYLLSPVEGLQSRLENQLKLGEVFDILDGWFPNSQTVTVWRKELRSAKSAQNIDYSDGSKMIANLSTTVIMGIEDFILGEVFDKISNSAPSFGVPVAKQNSLSQQSFSNNSNNNSTAMENSKSLFQLLNEFDTFTKNPGGNTGGRFATASSGFSKETSSLISELGASAQRYSDENDDDETTALLAFQCNNAARNQSTVKLLKFYGDNAIKLEKIAKAEAGVVEHDENSGPDRFNKSLDKAFTADAEDYKGYIAIANKALELYTATKNDPRKVQRDEVKRLIQLCNDTEFIVAKIHCKMKEAVKAFLSVA